MASTFFPGSGPDFIISITAAPETVSSQQERLYHGGRLMEWRCISWWQTLSWNGRLGKTLERRCQERLLRWSRKSSIMAADSIMEWTVVTITAARKTPYVICQQERLSHEGTEDSMSIMAVRETPSRWRKGLTSRKACCHAGHGGSLAIVIQSCLVA